MPTPAGERVAVLVVRAWHEGEGPSALRARITWVDDVAAGAEQTALAAGVGEVVEVVRRWLEGLAGPAGRQ
jgi:hypothetical protein